MNEREKEIRRVTESYTRPHSQLPMRCRQLQVVKTALNKYASWALRRAYTKSVFVRVD